MKTDEKHSLDWRPKKLWDRQGLASMIIVVVFMVQLRVMIGAVVTTVEPPGGAIKMELVLGIAATQLVELHVHIFGLTRQNCVASDTGGDGVVSLNGINSMSVWSRGTIFFVVINMVASLALVADDMTNLIISAMVRMGPLCLGIGSSSERKMWSPAQLQA